MEGTDNPVDLILYGDKGHSQPVIIGGAENFSFSKGQVDVFDVSPLLLIFLSCTVEPVLSSHSKSRPNIVFKTAYHLMQVKSIVECSKGSILQYFLPAFSYRLSLRSLLCLFLSGCFTQVLL